jgi:predicted acyltransferase
LGYTLLFVLWSLRTSRQLAAAVLILAGHWALFYFYPTPAVEFDYRTVGLPNDWNRLEGAEAHWEKNANVATDIDRVVLNWLPRHQRFEYGPRGYATLNFVPSIATMIFGLIAGTVLRGERSQKRKLAILLVSGFGCLLLGALLDASGYCPMIKRLWTPSWTLYSAGWVLLMLSVFFASIDLLNFRRWTWPLKVAGMNPLFLYCISQTIGWPDDWLARTLESCLGAEMFTFYGAIDPGYAVIPRTAMVLAVEWLACACLYRRKIFVRL